MLCPLERPFIPSYFTLPSDPAVKEKQRGVFLGYQPASLLMIKSILLVAEYTANALDHVWKAFIKSLLGDNHYKSFSCLTRRSYVALR